MAKKSIILDNGDGRVTFSNTASVSIDDVTSNISASVISASSISLSGIGVGAVKLLSASNGTLTAFPDGIANGGAIAFDGTKWVPSTIAPNDCIGTASGDLSGTFDGDVKVVNISNVSAGTLPVGFGGTGKSLTAGQNYILKVSSSAGSTPVISAIQGVSGSVLSVKNERWRSVPPDYPNVSFYTSSSGINTFTWTRPANTQFVRIILQGAGGGGGGGVCATSAGVATGGGGGGSGGFTDVIIKLNNANSATLSVGLGGAGGPATTVTTNGASGGNGGTTSFTLNDGRAYSATGGTGGYKGNNPGGAPGGAGLTINGGYGAYGVVNSATITQAWSLFGISTGGGKGGSSGVSNNGAASSGGTVYGSNFASLIYNIDDYANSINLIIGAGAAGSSNSTPPSKPSGFGAGGGGGFGTTTALANGSAGGPGANGYALVVSW